MLTLCLQSRQHFLISLATRAFKAPPAHLKSRLDRARLHIHVANLAIASHFKSPGIALGLPKLPSKAITFDMNTQSNRSQVADRKQRIAIGSAQDFLAVRNGFASELAHCLEDCGDDCGVL
ncbi:hypothetical protein DV532_28365 (plasmid) [Pseudomonas sp. Leaf58]|nr:hypothetical protein DV532_28365 [Pseudomonas sp. Leaf58]KQN62267.1 hypothetical protein ASF02_08875 [Pseudomonas sp. Leaf58]